MGIGSVSTGKAGHAHEVLRNTAVQSWKEAEGFRCLLLGGVPRCTHASIALAGGKGSPSSSPLRERDGPLEPRRQLKLRKYVIEGFGIRVG